MGLYFLPQSQFIYNDRIIITGITAAQKGYNLDGSLSRSWVINMSSKKPNETKDHINMLFIISAIYL